MWYNLFVNDSLYDSEICREFEFTLSIKNMKGEREREFRIIEYRDLIFTHCCNIYKYYVCQERITILTYIIYFVYLRFEVCT